MTDRITAYADTILSTHKRPIWGVPLEERAKAVAAIEDGKSFREVTKTFHIGTTQLQTYCRSCGVGSARQRMSKERVEGLFRELENGLSVADVAKLFGISERQVYRYKKAKGVK
jgi:transposase